MSNAEIHMQQNSKDEELFLEAYHNASEKASLLSATLAVQMFITALMTGIHIGNTERMESK